MTENLTERLQSVLSAGALRGWMHAVDLDTGRAVGLGADELVVAASVFKIPVLAELCRQYATGELDPLQRVRLRPDDFPTLGGTGVSVTSDQVELSLRDLALSMMTVSDNRATDVILDLVGLARVNATMREWGLGDTELAGDCAYLFRTMSEDLGLDVSDASAVELTRVLASSRDVLRATTPSLTSHTTPRETTDLLARIWHDRLLEPAGCAEIRRILGLQVWPHRLAAGFPEPGTKVSGKTGTLAHLRSEAGVVENPAGRYAVAVFVSSEDSAPRNPVADAAIGRLGRLMVEALGFTA